MAQISDNLIAAFLDGKTKAQETLQIIEAAKHDKKLKAFLEYSNAIDKDIEAHECKQIPLTALAASENSQANRCVILCELYVLNRHDIKRSISEWEKQARVQGWLKDGGMALFNIGRMLEQECFSLERTFDNTLDKIERAINDNKDVIVVVDGKELTTDVKQLDREHLEDEFMGNNPNHAVVVKGVDKKNNLVYLYDPNRDEAHREYSIHTDLFVDAWNDSANYMITVSPRDYSTYVPHPIDLSDVELPEHLEELKEAIAENAHEVWAQGRKLQGWSYGPVRDDAKKQTPDMVPYSDLTEDEKYFDRELAMNTIKLLQKLGYKIIKV